MNPALRQYQGMSVLVTGGKGFLGSRLVAQLARVGTNPQIIDFAHAGMYRLCLAGVENVQCHAIDISDRDALREKIIELKPAKIFHLAAYSVDPSHNDLATALHVNVLPVETMLETQATLGIDPGPGVGFLACGSVFEYGHHGGETSQTTHAAPQTAYAISKLAATHVCLSVANRLSWPSAVVRPFHIYGPGEKAKRLVPFLIKKLSAGEPLPLTGGEQIRDFCYVADVAEAILRIGLAPKAIGKIINVGTGVPTSLRHLAALICSLLHADENLCQWGSLPYREDEMWELVADIQLLESITEWKPPTTLKAGLEKTIESMAQKED